jgi:hypothetical protein
VEQGMTHTLTIQIDDSAVLRDLYVFLHTNEFEPLMDVDNENANLGPIVGQDYLVKAIICTHVYERLRGYKWRSIGRVGGLNDCFADVEFQSKADAMLWKLANP